MEEGGGLSFNRFRHRFGREIMYWSRRELSGSVGISGWHSTAGMRWERYIRAIHCSRRYNSWLADPHLICMGIRTLHVAVNGSKSSLSP